MHFIRSYTSIDLYFERLCRKLVDQIDMLEALRGDLFVAGPNRLLKLDPCRILCEQVRSDCMRWVRSLPYYRTLRDDAVISTFSASHGVTYSVCSILNTCDTVDALLDSMLD